VVRGIVRFFACVVLVAMLTSADGAKSNTPGDIRALLRHGKTDEALKLAESALARLPQDADMNAALGDVYFRLAEFELAERAYRKALDVEFNCARAHYGMGRLLEASSRWKSARAAYEKAHALDANDIEILRTWAMGRREAANEIAALERYWDSAAHEEFWLRERAWSRLEWRRMVGNSNTFVVNGPQATHRIAITRIRTPLLRGYRVLAVIFNSGKTARLALDSSMSGVVLKPRAAGRIGLKPRPVGRSADDPRFGGWAWADRFRIGTIEFRDCPIRVKGHALPADVDGTIGTDVFRMFLVKLDFPRDQLDLSPLPSAPRAASVLAHLSSWPDADARRDSSPSSAVSFLNVADNLMVKVLAEGRVSGYFLFEPRLGANAVTVEFARLLRLPTRPLYGINRGIYSNYRTFGVLHTCPGTTLRFGAVEQTNSTFYAHYGELEEQRIGVRIAGHLGVPNPADFTVTINYRDGWIDFQLAR
jgi:hypothetical protein